MHGETSDHTTDNQDEWVLLQYEVYHHMSPAQVHPEDYRVISLVSL